MDKRKNSLLIGIILLISSATIALAYADKGHSIFKIGADRSKSDTFFGEISEYASGNAELDVGSIKEIEVNWKSGDIILNEYDGDKIKIEEKSGKELNDNERLKYLSKNGKLIVRYDEYINNETNSEMLNKELNIYIPKTNRHLINEVKLNTINSNIKIYTNNVDGVQVNSINGSINISGKYKTLEVDNASGNVGVNLSNSPKNIGINILNGNLILKIPENKGFLVENDIKNGNFECEFPLTMKGNYAIYKKAKMNIIISIINGDANIDKVKM